VDDIVEVIRRDDERHVVVITPIVVVVRMTCTNGKGPARGAFSQSDWTRSRAPGTPSAKLRIRSRSSSSTRAVIASDPPGYQLVHDDVPMPCSPKPLTALSPPLNSATRKPSQCSSVLN